MKKEKRYNQPLEEGDLIELIYMDDPYNPISPLTRGIVMGFERVPGGEDKILVTWVVDPENDKMYNMPMIPEVDVWRKLDVDPPTLTTPTGRGSRNLTEGYFPGRLAEQEENKRINNKPMKKIKLTESTLQRIVERVIMEKESETANKQLMILFQKKKKGEDVDAQIKELLLNNPHLKDLQAALTPKGEQEIKKA